ncbi:aspartyl-tRNA synthetase [Rhizobium sp. BK226]|uniref:aspartate--tRNA(Asn) ligase n=1 Tax=Rhizobium TaxID=379 RepID=UPI000BE8DAB8|nr:MULTISPECIES: aspartate--tRNA(Asn) ligase [Rhizobium]MBB3300926.1 aspartyl-tRNA synthetase [Rhizobium sp. BK112]MBB3368549.1 aspartyl-tRNA synthetase [Rhizobium sp. BK077]MBB4112834.1 aspartyl-tRNA synthetase [Rhizobium sp. BK226]MBB4180816.1 aspartyl-tRNA synthetase [Rhizobium sp. BK109]PDS34470.1 aspartate--tRNA(Asn) ligase [Rhizobium anhuiense]
MLEKSPLKRSVIAQLPMLVGQRVRLCGFAEAIRDQKRMRFIVLRDHTGKVQLTHSKDNLPLTAVLDALTSESAVAITGLVTSAPGVKLGGLEVSLETADVCGLADARSPIDEESSLDKWIDHRQVSLRYPRQQLVFSVQTALEEAMRSFWGENGFRELHSPKLMGTFSESGSEVFAVKYFGTTAFLAQSPQFYKQMAIAGGMERVFEIGPAFRAEPSFTSRHETEFTSIDMEVAWIDDHYDLMDLEERWLAHSVSAVAKGHGTAIKELFDIEISPPKLPFPKITFEEARQTLAMLGHNLQKSHDLDAEGERILSEWMTAKTGHEFLFITDYPAQGRAFYHMCRDDEPHLTKGFDLLWRGMEITTGAQREHRYDRLVAQASERGYKLDALSDYLEFFRYGCPPHGGMGVGLARVLMRLFKTDSIREVTLLSRTPKRLRP